MTEREALKLALEALEKSHTCPLLPDDCAEAITAIKEALEQPEQEPVCIGWDTKTDTPIFTTPPQRKPLTDDDMEQIAKKFSGSFASLVRCLREVEAAHGIKGEA